MRILVATNHLQQTGGTETYTYALAVELKKQGHNVEYFAFDRGEVSDLLEQAGVPYMSRKKYDLILANHIPVVKYFFSRGFVIQTCHGTLVQLEQPSHFADAYVAVTEEIRNHLQSKGYKSSVIHNGVDCSRFYPTRPVNPTLTSVLSLCQSKEANDFISGCCSRIGVDFMKCDKRVDNVWNVEEKINSADLVVGIGRSVYDSMACGRCVLSYDFREYMDGPKGCGYLNAENFDEALVCNCSGRGFAIEFNEENFIDELNKYNSADAVWARETALRKLNVSVAAQNYISIYNKCKRDFWFLCGMYFRRSNLSLWLLAKRTTRVVRDSLRVVRKKLKLKK